MPRIKRKKTFGIINFPESNSNDVESVRYCPNCSSILQKWILDFEQNDKAIKVPNKLQCLTCGEIVTIYHPSSLT
jgi:hypothetical protein